MEKMNKPTRLRMILLRHLKEINPNVCVDKIEALEDDIKTFVKFIHYGAKEIGLELTYESFIGDMD